MLNRRTMLSIMLSTAALRSAGAADVYPARPIRVELPRALLNFVKRSLP
jgi:hypothetical protein